jgi:phage tail-like protein
MKLPESRCEPVGSAPQELTTPGLRTRQIGDQRKKQPELVVYPGEASELLVQITNVSSDDLELEVAVSGAFPSDWCQLGVEGSRLPRGSTIEAVLYFQIAPDFFESPAGHQGGQPFTLDYPGLIEFAYHPVEGEVTERYSREFMLFVRPRSLYLDFLPDLFREVDFVARFLKVFEETLEPNVHMLANLWAYLNPKTAPEAMLPFLAHWVGWPLTPQLPLSRQRQLIAGAVQLYQWRGTRRGLRFAIHLFTDLPFEETVPEAEKAISIQELGGRGFIMGETRLGRDATMGGGQPYHFIVTLRHPVHHEIDRALIEQVIDQEKPAFCTYELYTEVIDISGLVA